ncbi:MAG TPA: outer membrane beta-barrel protein [Saprospiraceae bacterium]|nr:outer membrane beta-barrel protein [Saprospiraceae bacterium]
MKQLIISTLCIFLIYTLDAQKNIYVGVETGVTNDRFEFFDDGDFMVNVALNNLRLGAVLGYSFNDFLSIESGFVMKEYSEGFGFEFPMHHGSTTSTSIRTWQIPLRIKPRVKLFSDNLFFTPVIGFHYCINRDHLFRNEHESLNSNSFFNYHYNADYTQFRTFPLMETGLGFEMNILDKLRFNFTISYFTGFKQVIEMDINYTVDDGPDIIARGHSKGEYLNVSLGVHYPIIGRFR